MHLPKIVPEGGLLFSQSLTYTQLNFAKAEYPVCSSSSVWYFYALDEKIDILPFVHVGEDVNLAKPQYLIIILILPEFF